MKIKYLATLVLAVVMLLLFTDTAFAGCPCEVDSAPPQLDEQQANLWKNTSHIGRIYLARLWDVDQHTAKLYGMLDPKGTERWDVHFSAYDVNSGAWDVHSAAWNVLSTRWGVHIEETTPVKYPELPTDETFAMQYDAPPNLDMVQVIRWAQALPFARGRLSNLYEIPGEGAVEYRWLYRIDVTTPVKYPELPKSEPIVIKYNAPPNLDIVQQARWGQALPSARKYLAVLYGISDEEARQYGAR